jgi:subtilisin family serine protease
VEFRAAGVDVPVAWRDGATAVVTGSSFAAPHVAALVARLRERHPAWNATQVKAALYEIAHPAVT